MDVSAGIFCYICDNATDCDTSDKLLSKCTETTRISFPKVISSLISDEFVLIVGKEDVVCQQCRDIVNRLDELQHQVSVVRKILSEFLSKKYHIPINDPYEEPEKGIEDLEEIEENVLYESNFCEDVNTIANTLNEKNSCNRSKNKSGLKKKSIVCEGKSKTAQGDYAWNSESDNSVSNEVTSNTENIESNNEVCFVDNSGELSYDHCDKRNKEEVNASYLVCELCHTLLKTTSEINNHVCQEEDLGNSKKVSFKDIVEIEQSNPQDNMVEITIIENLLDKETTKPFKKDMKLNLCCFICDAILPSRSDLALHVLSHYPVKRSKKKGTVCPVCDANYTSLIDFMNHYDSHIDVSANKTKCKESALSNSKVDIVETRISTEDATSDRDTSDKFPCPFCKKLCDDNSELNNHLKLKHNINTCRYCKKEFPSDLKLKEHLVVHEAKIKPSQCEYCLLRFNPGKELESHIKTAHDQIKTTKACPLCRKKCGSNFSVKAHVLKNHLIPVLQQEIREKYSHGSDLVDDMKSLGASEKVIKSITDVNKPVPVDNNVKNSKIIINVEASDVSFCLLCGFSSKSIPNLDRHREKHSAKRIQCPLLCEHLSCDSDDLTAHLSESHNILLTENCCPHCLNEPEENLILHMTALHSKFYTHLTCFMCKEMFFSKENLKYHFSLTHLIFEQRFEEKGDDTEMDDNSTEADDPLESGEAIDENMNNELTVALESITNDSQQGDPLADVENEDLTTPPDIKLEESQERKDFICLVCRKECKSDEDLAVHTCNHATQAENTSCSFCTSVFYDSLCLNQHIIKEHPQITHKYCFSCGKLFNSKFALVKHLSTKCCSRTCFLCGKQFKKISLFILHLTYAHRKDWKCVYCNKMCRNVKHLNYHEALHERYKGKVFKCDVCCKTFLTPNTLKSHSVTHTGNYPFVCEFCGRGFISSYGLGEHRASHTGDIRYCCEICGKSFRLYDTYNRHRRQHDDPFPAQCSECGIKFRNASRVSEHKRKVHTGERPYACPYCPMAFNVTSSYHIHLCKHTKVYPYNCDRCNRGFASRFKFANHLAAVHNDHSFVSSKN